MIALVVLVRDLETVAVRVQDRTVLNHVRQLATFLGRDIEIHVYDPGGAKWRGRGECVPVVPRGQMPLLGGVR